LSFRASILQLNEIATIIFDMTTPATTRMRLARQGGVR
jgi:hypothetical protein